MNKIITGEQITDLPTDYFDLSSGLRFTNDEITHMIAFYLNFHSGTSSEIKLSKLYCMSDNDIIMTTHE